MAHQFNHYKHHTQWHAEKVFVSADDFFAAMQKDIHNATHSIDMDYYIFELDALGKRILEELIFAAKRGVRVRLMIDGLGSLFSANEIASLVESHGINIKIFHPAPFALHLYQWSNEKGSFIQKFLHFLAHINHRNHHKICLIDQDILYTGSFNISQNHLSQSAGGNNWHDIGVRIQDSHLITLGDSFDLAFHQHNISHKKLHLQKLRNNFSALMRRISNSLMVRQLSHAEHRIWICTAYFSPSSKVLRAIKKARKRNVDIRIILPSKSDIFFIPILSRTYYQLLLNMGVTVYEYQPSILHAKILLIDEQCIIGSTNLNHRSFHHDLEMDIVLTHPSSIKDIEQQLLSDIASSTKMTQQHFNNHPLQYCLARMLLLFRYWL